MHTRFTYECWLTHINHIRSTGWNLFSLLGIISKCFDTRIVILSQDNILTCSMKCFALITHLIITENSMLTGTIFSVFLMVNSLEPGDISKRMNSIFCYRYGMDIVLRCVTETWEHGRCILMMIQLEIRWCNKSLPEHMMSRFMTPYGVTRPQWVLSSRVGFFAYSPIGVIYTDVGYLNAIIKGCLPYT